MARRRKRKISLDLLLGSSVRPETSRAGGTALGAYRAGIEASQDRRRLNLLKTAISSGEIDENQLGTKDQRLLSSGLSPTVDLGDRDEGGKSVGGFLKNLFGSDQGLIGVLKGLPQAGYEIGTKVAPEVADALLMPGGTTPLDLLKKESQLRQVMVDPTIKDYKYMYGGEGAKGKNFWDRFYEAPLGPVLDVAAVGSVGAGVAGRLAQAAKGAGASGKLTDKIAKIHRIDTRPPVVNNLVSPRAKGDEGFQFPEVERVYAPGALRKLFQVGADRSIHGRGGTGTDFGEMRLPGLGSLRERSINRALKGQANRNVGRLDLDVARRMQQRLERLGPTIAPRREGSRKSGLTEREGIALSMIRNGLTLQPRPDGTTYLDAQSRNWERSLMGENPEGFNVTDFVDEANIPEEAARQYVVQQIKNAQDPEIRALVEAPTPRMFEAARAFEAERKPLLDELDIDEGEDLKRAYLTQRDLDRDEEGNFRQDPEELATAFQEYADVTGAFDQKLADGETFRLGPAYLPQRTVSGLRTTMQGNLKPAKRKRSSAAVTSVDEAFRPPRETYLDNNELMVIKAGMMDTSPRVMTQFLGRVEKDLAQAKLLDKELATYAIKGPDGEPRKFKNAQEMQRELGTSENWDFLPEGAEAVRFYRHELNLGREVTKTIDEVKVQDGVTLSIDDFMQDRLNSIIDENAKNFVRELLGAKKNVGYAVPRTYSEYRRKLANVQEPFNNPVADGWIKLRNKWVQATLAYMPRWYVNNAAGGATLALISGVINPRDFITARRMQNRGAIPPELGMGLTAREMSETGLINASALTKRLFQANFRTDQFFRTAVFVKQLRRFERERMADIGDQMKSFSPIHEGAIMQSGGNPVAYLRAIDQSVDNIMGYDRTTGQFDPDRERLVDMAASEANRFAYNHLVMGPDERRYIRNFGVPFWGWYRFITTVSWRLPVDHPGRTQLLNQLGQIGQDAEEDLLGEIIPAWIKGSILLNKDPGNLKYLPTMGFNPFAGVANPFGEEGPIQGLLSPGQLVPPIQAAMKGLGIDPFLGGDVPIAPETGVALDFFGQPVDTKEGRSLNSLGAVGGLQRTAFSLLRSIPHVSLAEQTLTGGRPVYPESPPWNPRPMLTKNPRDVSPQGNALRLLGAAVRDYDVEGWRSLERERVEYARTRNKNELRKRRRQLNSIFGGGQ